MIEFKEVRIGYSAPLATITLDKLDAGFIYALIGSNGSGKSTFLKTICGKQKPINGSVFINGKNIAEMSRKEMSSMIAFVPSKFPDTDFISVFDFIALGRTPYLNNLGHLSDQDVKIVEQVIDQIQINHLISKHTTQLSDGERQLCAVARALAQQTPIILLDEPTGFLDYRNKRRLLSLLERLTKNLNITTLLSTHDIESIRNFDIKLIGIEANSDQKKLEFVDENMPFETTIDLYYR